MSLLDRAKLTGGEPEPEPVGTQPAGADVIELDADPEPGRRTRRAGRRQAAAASSSASSSGRSRQARSGGKFVGRDQIKGQIADEVNMYAKMLALTWSMSDEHCSVALNDSSKAIADSLSALLVRSDWVVEHYQTAGLFGDVVKLLHALLPVGRAIFAHHVAGRGDQDDPGEVERVTVADDYGAGAAGGVTYGPWRPHVAG